jgi:hypothetical protein
MLYRLERFMHKLRVYLRLFFGNGSKVMEDYP